MRRSFAHHLLHALLPEGFDPLSNVLLAVEVRFTHHCGLRYGVKVDRFLCPNEDCNGLLYPFALLLFALLGMCGEARCIALPVLFTHVLPPGCVVDAVPIPPGCTRVHTCQSSRRHDL